MTVGEDNFDLGDIGVKRAKDWLLRSTRVTRAWTRHDRLERQLLVVPWAAGNRTFSFDVGGSFVGEELDGLPFLAEVKNYSNGENLRTEFRDFLAKAYRTAVVNHSVHHRFLWISWVTYGVDSWEDRCSIASVRDAILHSHNRERTTGHGDPATAAASLDLDVLASVSDRLWMITLSKHQEGIVPTLEHFREIRAALAVDEVSA